MRNSLLLITLATVLILGPSSPLRAQAPPVAAAQILTNREIGPGIFSSAKLFEWKSGPLSVFLDRIKEDFGTDLRQRADIPEQMLETRVPTMKVNTARVWDVLDLYNQISTDYPKIGRWVVQWPAGAVTTTGPSAILFLPTKQTDAQSGSEFTIRAFSMRGLSEEDRNAFFSALGEEKDWLLIYAREGRYGLNHYLVGGEYRLYDRADLLVATGGKLYVDLVAALLEGFRERTPAKETVDATKQKEGK